MKIHLTGDEIAEALTQYVGLKYGLKGDLPVHTKLVYQSNCLGLKPGTFTAEVEVADASKV